MALWAPLLLFFFLLFARIEANSLFPSELLSKIRFYHLQEVFYHYETEKALTQSEHYLAQDLAESIEDASFVVGMTTNPSFLPIDQSNLFAITQRLSYKYQHLSLFQLRFLLLSRAHDVFVRQQYMEASAIMLDELEKDWGEWWDLLHRCVTTAQQAQGPFPRPPQRQQAVA